MKTTRRSFLRAAALSPAAAAAATAATVHATAQFSAAPAAPAGRAGTASSAGGREAANAPTVAPKGLAKAPRQPNILFLWTDQHRGDTVPWAGNRAVQAGEFFAPLGERSFVFQRACVTQPVCTPSRGSIMTGLWPHRHGSIHNNVKLRDDCRSIAEYLPGEYATAYYGKWHLGDENKAQHGFRDWRSIEDLYRSHYTDPEDLKRFSDYHEFLVGLGFPPDRRDEETGGAAVFSREMAAAMPEPYTKVSFLAQEAETFLRARKDGQPFLLSVNCLEPHPPTYGPLNALHDPAAMPTGPSFGRNPEGKPRLVRRQWEQHARQGYKNHPIATEADWRRLRANYYGLVTMVDRSFARILRALVESGQADRTIVVYTSDHGDMCGDHALMQKGNFLEGSVHVPLAIHVPWLSRRRVDFQAPISTVDLTPTVLDLAGFDPGSAVDGRSRAGALRDPESFPRENITVEWNDSEDEALSGRSRVSHDGWKLNLYRDDAPELFDLNTDPGEQRNLAGAPAHRDRFRRLAEELAGWQQTVRDTLPLQA